MVIKFAFIFFISWWIVLLMVLPFGVKVPDNIGEGHADSAPENPRILLKMFITTIITIFVTWGILHIIENYGDQIHSLLY